MVTSAAPLTEEDAMPVVQNYSKLPGTNPMFHEFRKYMAPVTHKGREILGYFASCKQSDCNFRAAWGSNNARIAGMFTHRSQIVLEARYRFFAEMFKPILPFTEVDPDRIADAIIETADKHTHTLENWVEHVETLYGHYTDGDSLPTYPKLEIDYYMGASAREVARNVIAHHIEKK